MRPLRLVAWLLILLALGIETSLGVAWTLAWRTGQTTSPDVRHWMFVADGMPFYAAENRRAGARHRTISAYDGPYSAVTTQTELGNVEPWPSWGRTASLGAERQSMDGWAHGWPFVCMWHEQTWLWTLSGSVRLTIHGGRQWTSTLPATSTIRVLPLRPIWTPLCLNTALYAAAWSLLPLTTSTLIKTRRRRRGACTNCGYTLHGLTTTPVCPECGAPIPPNAKCPMPDA